MNISEQINSQLSGIPMQQISQQLGVDQSTAQGAVAAALPLLLGALGRNAAQPQGAQALFGALQNDHAGGNDLGALLGSVLGGGQSRQTDGAGILGHIFGGQQQQAAAGLGQVAGLDGSRSNMLLKILAPIVMAYLARNLFGGGGQATAGGSAPSADVLSGVLGQEQQRIQQQGGPAGGLLGAIFDRDGDGQVGLGDVLKMGGSIFGNKS